MPKKLKNLVKAFLYTIYKDYVTVIQLLDSSY